MPEAHKDTQNSPYSSRTEREDDRGQGRNKNPPALSSSILNILILDDQIEEIELFKEILHENGIVAKLKSFNEFAKAREYIHKGHEIQGDVLPDIIITDIYLPQGDGKIFLKELKESAKTGNIPVIMYSSSRKDEDIITTYYEKADGYLSKPLNIKEFTEIVKSLSKMTVASVMEK